VVGLSETLQKDLRRHDIGVSVLCPMGVTTQIRQSARNRPPALRNTGAPESGGEVELIGRYLSPEQVAERVLRAVLDNRLYVITHPEGLEPLRRRFARMEKAIQESQ
jgi:short-subunit dehydrogenase